MRGITGPMGWLIGVFIGVVFVALGVGFILTKIIFASGADDQLAFANAEKLRAAINQACIEGTTRGNARPIDLHLAQNKPFTQPTVGSQPALPHTFFFTQFRIRGDGDPKYLLYHETFPPGEAVGWETFHDFEGSADYRIIAMVDGGQSITAEEKSAIVDEIKKQIKARYIKAKKPVVLVGNVMLTGAVDLTEGVMPGKTVDKDEESFLHNDAWDKTLTKFSFGNYYALSAVEKTLPKYNSCGADKLCLKTRAGVHALPLDEACADKYIQFVNTGSSVDAKYADFHLASPCRGNSKVKVYRDNCANALPTIDFGALWKGQPAVTLHFDKFGQCKKFVTYPLYQMNEDGTAMTTAGQHVSCLDSVAGDKSQADDVRSMECIRVEFEQKGDFCTTTNVQAEGIAGLTRYISIVNPDVIRLDFENKIKPVFDSTDYVQLNIPLSSRNVKVHAFVMEYYPPDLPLLEQLFKDFTTASWVWPF